MQSEIKPRAAELFHYFSVSAPNHVNFDFREPKDTNLDSLGNKMQGRTYYLTTLSAWQVESAHFTTSHYIHADPTCAANTDTKILALVEADEGTHNSLSQNPVWLELPHPLSPKIIPEGIAQALSPLGVTPFSSSFETTECVAKLHPILRHRVF